MIFRANKNSIIITFKNKLIWFFLYLINIPFLFLIIIIFPIFKIRINQLETRSIGHFSISTEIFLAELRNKMHGKNPGLFVWFRNKKISNNFLLKKLKKEILIGPRVIFKPIFSMINKIDMLSFLRSPFRHWKYLPSKEKTLWQIRDIHKVLQKIKPIIRFNKLEEKSCQNYLKKMNIYKENYLCFFARTHHFRNDAPSVRDSNVDTQLPGIINNCKKNNFKAIRLGDNEQKKITNKSKFLIDYSHSKYKSPILDLYLPMNCKFMVGASSGISHMPILNRKKILITDFTQFHDLDYTPDYYIPILLPKKYKRISTNKIINYSEVFHLGLTKIQYDHELLKMGYVTVPNSKKEILLAINEMDKLVNSNKKFIEDTVLQKKFWKILRKYYKIAKPINLKISNNFLKLNKQYIN
jgi:putative glycosyltransferase (TIGR04372 family)|tara:strand:- start:322 stop:1554 length:1233 start_codon:yes stop_codon:yes gene_type:complete